MSTQKTPIKHPKELPPELEATRAIKAKEYKELEQHKELLTGYERTQAWASFRDGYAEGALAVIEMVAKKQEEIDCLRSVCHEWDQDKTCFTQWVRAEELKAGDQ